MYVMLCYHENFVIPGLTRNPEISRLPGFTSSFLLFALRPDFHNNLFVVFRILAAVYAQMGSYSKAVSAFEEAVRLNPDDRAAQQNLKMAYERIKGRKKE
jgi:tetratricopeptide (TPR) repeat protein